MTEQLISNVSTDETNYVAFITGQWFVYDRFLSFIVSRIPLNEMKYRGKTLYLKIQNKTSPFFQGIKQTLLEFKQLIQSNKTIAELEDHTQYMIIQISNTLLKKSLN